MVAGGRGDADSGDDQWIAIWINVIGLNQTGCSVFGDGAVLSDINGVVVGDGRFVSACDGDGELSEVGVGSVGEGVGEGVSCGIT